MWRSRCSLLKRDFDAWAYNIFWPQEKAFLPLLGFASLTVEDIKFAYNAWCLLRLAMFYGCEHPKVLSPLVNVTPSMDIAFGGNRVFYMHAEVEARLSQKKIKVALTPSHPEAQPLQNFPWQQIVSPTQEGCKEMEDYNSGVEIVLGMENGLSESVIEECDYCVYIPQYGSIGSLSMLSAMAIVLHSAHSAQQVENTTMVQSVFSKTSQGHMPLSNGFVKENQGKPLPHEKDLLSFSNDEIVKILETRRLSYKMQLSLMIYNEFGDRNIGAIMRNANVFNCEKMIVLNRKKFSRRGAVGTQHLLQTLFYDGVDDADCNKNLDGYVIWVLYQYYPYIKIHNVPTNENESTFIRPENTYLQKWLKNHHSLSKEHPISDFCDIDHLIGSEVYLDDSNSLYNAVKDALNTGYRGIMLAIPEEGTSPHPDILKKAQRVVYMIHPNHLAHDVQRGLNGALSSAIALERIRTAIDNL
ncbi:putative SpoU type methylase [Trypanosoma theileri]|uniref:Putative SpoU type methylase n=1 Tax=Trypanosoma theileri TaxID=67003 RepID=A0A1X0NN27_9TRYP|nr:putative SpoU type methylase [Trypanosoma theileri]ORC85903.1 putative SpoU type methylase [Trypanosoma theileri]